MIDRVPSALRYSVSIDPKSPCLTSVCAGPPETNLGGANCQPVTASIIKL